MATFVGVLTNSSDDLDDDDVLDVAWMPCAVVRAARMRRRPSPTCRARRGGDPAAALAAATAYRPACLARRQLPVTIETQLIMIMALDDSCLACGEGGFGVGVGSYSPSRASTAAVGSRKGGTVLAVGAEVVDEEAASFLRKYALLSKDELSAALMVCVDQVHATLAQEVSCVGCRRSVEEMCRNIVGGAGRFAAAATSAALEPIVISADDVIGVNRDHVRLPAAMANLFCKQLRRLKVHHDENQPKNGKKSGGRCLNHMISAKKTASNTFMIWNDVWKSMEPICQEEVLMLPFALIRITIDRYLKKHSFCSECSNMVNQAYYLLIQGSGNDNRQDEATNNLALADVKSKDVPGDASRTAANTPVSAKTKTSKTAESPPVKNHLYDGFLACEKEQHLHIDSDPALIGRLMQMAEPELIGQKQERHAKTIEIAQKEILTCIGITLYERFLRIQQKLREGQQTCDLLFLVALRALKKSFDLAVEKKQGFSDLEKLCHELDEEEKANQVRAAKKKEKKQNAKKKQKEKENSNRQQETEVKEGKQRDVLKSAASCNQVPSPAASAACTVNGTASASSAATAAATSPSSSVDVKNSSVGVKKGQSKSPKSQPKKQQSSVVAAGRQAAPPRHRPPMAETTLFDSNFSILSLDKMYRDCAAASGDANYGYENEDDEEALGDEEMIPLEDIESFQERQSLVNQQREKLRETLKKRFATLCANGL